MAIQVCYACKGAKKILGLGIMLKDCPNCHGIGHVREKKTEQDTNVRTIRKKRGRRKINHKPVLIVSDKSECSEPKEAS